MKRLLRRLMRRNHTLDLGTVMAKVQLDTEAFDSAVARATTRLREAMERLDEQQRGGER